MANTQQVQRHGARDRAPRRAGRAKKEVAHLVALSPKTIEGHFSNVYRRLRPRSPHRACDARTRARLTEGVS